MARAGHTVVAYDDYSDMKQLYGRKVVETITHMTSDEILVMDRYDEDGNERHELREIVEALLALADTPTMERHRGASARAHRAAGR